MKNARLFIVLLGWSATASASDVINILSFPSKEGAVDRSGVRDASKSLADAIQVANGKTAVGEPACVYIPPGVYKITRAPPEFIRAGCVRGDGPTQSIIKLDPKFDGDLFSWSEAWAVTTAGPTVIGIRVQGDESSPHIQNAFVFYDRNDEVFVDNVDVRHLHGRALYSGVTKHTVQAYLRESRFRSIRFSSDGAPNVPVAEFNSQGSGPGIDATNEIRISQLDIYGARGPSFVIRNNGSGTVRNIVIDGIRVEGTEHGKTEADLLTIGDPQMRGAVANVTLMAMELIDPYRGFAALRITAAADGVAPYQIFVEGLIGGGLANGQGLRIDAGRTSTFHFVGIHTVDTNVVIGRGVKQIEIDGGGLESSWTYRIDPTSIQGIAVPMLRYGDPSAVH
jgi:hypothetical protein